jgi:predicted PurR-regulated permease PerM
MQKMELKNYNTYFFFMLLLGVTVLAYFVVKPFLIAIVMGVILEIVFQRPYRTLMKLGLGRKMSALLTTLLCMFVIIVPFLIIIGLMGEEVYSLYQQIMAGSNLYQNYLDNLLTWIDSNQLLHSLGVSALFSKEALLNSFSQTGQYIMTFVSAAYSGIASIIFQAFVTLFSLYFFLLDGKKAVTRILYISPLKDSHEQLLIEKFISISRATIKGTLVVGFIQGLVGGIVFAIAGVPSVITWAVIMMILSLVPLIGSSIVWVPAGIILLLTGNVWQGLFVLLAGTFVISLLDNFLRPKLVGRDTQMHPLAVFFATVGGIMLFGFAGFVIGPIIMALFFALWDIYGIEFRTQLKRYNK